MRSMLQGPEVSKSCTLSVSITNVTTGVGLLAAVVGAADKAALDRQSS